MSYLLLMITHHLQQLGNHTELASLHGLYQHHDLLISHHKTSHCFQCHHWHILDLMSGQYMPADEHYSTVQQCQMGCNINNRQQMPTENDNILNQEILCFRQTVRTTSHIKLSNKCNRCSQHSAAAMVQWLCLMSHGAIQFNWYFNQTMQVQTIVRSGKGST